MIFRSQEYLKKRLIAIIPSYLLVALIWPIVNPEQLKDWALLMPVELFGIQTVYQTLFGILHNGGTWFVSCLLLAYVLYPVIKSVISSGKKRTPVLLIAITHFFLMYSNIIIQRFSLSDLYSNPIARSAEFMIGVSFAEILFRSKDIVDEEKAEVIEKDVEITQKSDKIKGFLTTVWGGAEHSIHCCYPVNDFFVPIIC